MFGFNKKNTTLKQMLKTSVDMDVVLKATSKDGAFAEKEFINPMALKLRRAFEALK